MSGGGWTYAQDKAWFRIPFTGKSFALQAPDRSLEGDEPTRFHFKLYGAGGGDPWENSPKPARGGFGGSCEGSYLFNSNETFFVYVGGKGGEG